MIMVNTCMKSMERTPLVSALPLAMPLSILIDPSNKCNFKCTFCPTGDKELLKSVGRTEEIMSIKTFKKIAKGLLDWRESTGSIPKQIGFYKDGEPLLNEHLCEFISTISRNNLSHRTYLTSNGALLTKQKSIDLAMSGLTEIRISVEHVTDKGYSTITQTKVPYRKILENIRCLWKVKQDLDSKLHIHVKTISDILTNEEKDQFLADFSSISDSIAFDRIMGWSDSANNDFSIGNIDHEMKKNVHSICSQPFSRMTICSNGDITICCVDWMHQLKYGNVNDITLMEAWNSGNLNSQRLDHLKGNLHEGSVCANCDHFKNQSPEDCIDQIRDRLIDYCNSRN